MSVITTTTATRYCPVCRVAVTGTGSTPFKAAVAAQANVLKHQLEHPYEAVLAASVQETR